MVSAPLVRACLALPFTVALAAPGSAADPAPASGVVSASATAASLQRGDAAFAAARYGDAALAYDQALVLWPDHPDVLVRAGQAKVLAGRERDAIPLLRRVAAESGAAPTTPGASATTMANALAMLHRAAIALGDAALAAHVRQRLEREFPAHPDTLRLRTQAASSAAPAAAAVQAAPATSAPRSLWHGDLYVLAGTDSAPRQRADERMGETDTATTLFLAAGLALGGSDSWGTLRLGGFHQDYSSGSGLDFSSFGPSATLRAKPWAGARVAVAGSAARQAYGHRPYGDRADARGEAEQHVGAGIALHAEGWIGRIVHAPDWRYLDGVEGGGRGALTWTPASPWLDRVRVFHAREGGNLDDDAQDWGARESGGSLRWRTAKGWSLELGYTLRQRTEYEDMPGDTKPREDLRRDYLATAWIPITPWLGVIGIGQYQVNTSTLAGSDFRRVVLGAGLFCWF